MKDISDVTSKRPQPSFDRSPDINRGHEDANVVQRIGSRDREAADQIAPASSPAEILQRYTRDKDRFYHDRAKSEIAFEDRGSEFKLGKEPSAQAIRDALLIAQTRGWKDIALAGSAAFKRDAYVEADLLGISIRDHMPDKQTVTALQTRRVQIADQLLRDMRPARPEPALARAYAALGEVKKTIDRTSNLTAEQKGQIFTRIRRDVAARLERGQSLSTELTAQRATTRTIHRDLTRDPELDR